MNSNAPLTRDISLEAIAPRLAALPCFDAQANEPYTVAEHSLNVGRCVDQHLRLPAVLSLAHRCYVDRPARRYVPDAGSLELRLDAAIAEHFGFDPAMFYAEEIEAAQARVAAAERRDLLPYNRQSRSALPEAVDWDVRCYRKHSQEKLAALFIDVVRRAGPLCVDPGASIIQGVKGQDDHG